MNKTMERLWRRIQKNRDTAAVIKLAAMLQKFGSGDHLHLIGKTSNYTNGPLTRAKCGLRLVSTSTAKTISDGQIFKAKTDGNTVCRKCLLGLLKSLCESCCSVKERYCDTCKKHKKDTSIQLIALIRRKIDKPTVLDRIVTIMDKK